MRQILSAGRIALFVLLPIAMATPALTSQRSAPEVAASGRRLFNQSCSACHETLGTAPKSGPGLRSYYHRQPHLSDAAVRSLIEHGKGKMPAFSTLNPSQVNDLVAYLKTL